MAKKQGVGLRGAGTWVNLQNEKCDKDVDRLSFPQFNSFDPNIKQCFYKTRKFSSEKLFQVIDY
jgi:hypothetical protein